MSKVKIRNIIDRSIVISEPDMRLRREILPNQTFTIDEEKLNEAMNSIGVANMFRRGFLRVEDGLKEENEDMFTDLGIDLENNKQYLSMEELKQIMENGTDFELKKAIQNNPEERISVIISAALAADGLTGSKIDLIEKFTGKNIIKLKNEQRNLSK